MVNIRTHKGKNIDMTALVKANEKVIAVGNLRLNARGDLIGKKGEVIKTKEQLAADNSAGKVTVTADAALNALSNTKSVKDKTTFSEQIKAAGSSMGEISELPPMQTVTGVNTNTIIDDTSAARSDTKNTKKKKPAVSADVTTDYVEE